MDDVLGATIGETEQDFNFRDTSVPELPLEQRIRKEEEVQTPPRREPRRGPRAVTDGMVLAPGGLADQRTVTAGRNRHTDEWSPVVALESTVSRMQRDLEDLQTENRFLRTPRAPVPVPLVRQAALPTTKVPWFNGSTSWEQYQQGNQRWQIPRPTTFQCLATFPPFFRDVISLLARVFIFVIDRATQEVPIQNI